MCNFSSQKIRGRKGREQHHYEKFIHREKERDRKIKIKAWGGGSCLVGVWLIICVICYLNG